MGDINDKVKELLEKQKQERRENEDFSGRMKNLVLGYRTGGLDADAARDEREKIHRDFRQYMESIGDYDNQLMQLFMERGCYDESRDLIRDD